MRKAISLLVIFLTTLFSFTNNQTLLANAASELTNEKTINREVINTEIIPLDESYYLEVITYDTTPTEVNTAVSAAATTRTVDAAKTHNIKNIYNTTVASYTLFATFTYNGSTSKCTSASHSETISNSYWSFTSAFASWTGNKAIGSYTAKCSSPSQTVSKTLTITCDANGNIS